MCVFVIVFRPGQQITTRDSGLHLKPDCKLQDNVLLVDTISAVTRLEQE